MVRARGLHAHPRDHEDAEQLPPTYDAWLERAEAGVRDLQTQGVDILHALIKPDEFVGWCAVRGLRPNSSARARYGSEAAAVALESQDVVLKGAKTG